MAVSRHCSVAFYVVRVVVYTCALQERVVVWLHFQVVQNMRDEESFLIQMIKGECVHTFTGSKRDI